MFGPVEFLSLTPSLALETPAGAQFFTSSPRWLPHQQQDVISGVKRSINCAKRETFMHQSEILCVPIVSSFIEDFILIATIKVGQSSRADV